jgi:hypothetical protein
VCGWHTRDKTANPALINKGVFHYFNNRQRQQNDNAGVGFPGRDTRACPGPSVPCQVQTHICITHKQGLPDTIVQTPRPRKYLSKGRCSNARSISRGNHRTTNVTSRAEEFLYARDHMGSCHNRTPVSHGGPLCRAILARPNSAVHKMLKNVHLMWKRPVWCGNLLAISRTKQPRAPSMLYIATPITGIISLKTTRQSALHTMRIVTCGRLGAVCSSPTPSSLIPLLSTLPSQTYSNPHHHHYQLLCGVVLPPPSAGGSSSF